MTDEPRRVLNAGSGWPDEHALHTAFRRDAWAETRVDIDPAVEPDIVASLLDLKGRIDDASFDAIWSSHSLEHLHSHEVIPALAEFRRMLKPKGFALVTCPDLDAVARLILDIGVEGIAYHSPAGPIRPLDMLFGHVRSVAEGRAAMTHNTGFTAARLGRVALEAGFAEARVVEGDAFDLWALLLGPDPDTAALEAFMRGTALERLFDPRRHDAPAAPAPLQEIGPAT